MFFNNNKDIPPLFHSAFSEQPFSECVDCQRELSADVLYIVQKHFVAGEAVFEMAICMECNQTLNARLSDESREAIHQFLEDRAAEVQQSKAALEPENLTSENSGEAEADDSEAGDDQFSDDAFWESLFPKEHELNPDDYLNECAYCGTARDDCRRHAITGLFQGDQMIEHYADQFNLHWPMIICEACVESANELISKQTRDEWNRFVEHNFDGPPGLEVDWKTQQPVFM
jgi:hypothetical protein